MVAVVPAEAPELQPAASPGAAGPRDRAFRSRTSFEFTFGNFLFLWSLLVRVYQDLGGSFWSFEFNAAVWSSSSVCVGVAAGCRA